MQEPDSFSQGLVGLLKLTHSRSQCRDLGLVRCTLPGSLSLDAGALLRWDSHKTTLSRNQPSVEITVEHRRPPPPETIIRDPP